MTLETPGSALRRVEREDVLHPSGSGEASRFLGHQLGTRGDHEHLVREARTVGQEHRFSLDLDAVDRRLQELDAVVELPMTGTDDVLTVGQPERHEQQPRW